jgi:DNA-directed RNA polymerase subunit RPC12/RpoP
MACKIKFHCQTCGAELEDEPDYTTERSDQGTERVVRTMPSRCKRCREKAFWGRCEGER